MQNKSPRWRALATSQYPWERDALDFVRERLPDQEPFRGWSLFELVGVDGSVNEDAPAQIQEEQGMRTQKTKGLRARFVHPLSASTMEPRP